ncbi:MAG: hypothetical protein ACOCWG_03090 [bacterium]
MNKNFNTPVLLIAFYRPDTTQKVIDSLREVQPRRLYIAVDGPRKHKSEEKNKVESVINVTKTIDWECEKKYLIRGENLGCMLGVTGAISWVFENEDRAIIIEDDIIASPSFFLFAEELLEKYTNDERIAMISANNYTQMNSIENDYIFSNYGHIWGWATWKRVWNKFDVNLPELSNKPLEKIETIKYLSRKEKKYYLKKFKRLYDSILNGSINTWDSQFSFFRRYNHLFSIVPKVNLASNIGDVSSRVDNSFVSKNDDNYYPAEQDFVIKNHPLEVGLNLNYEKYHFKNHIFKHHTYYKRIKRKIIKLLGING